MYTLHYYIKISRLRRRKCAKHKGA